MCMNCKKTVEPKTSTVGVCVTCNTTQKLNNKKLSARLFIQSNVPGQKSVTLKAYDDILRLISQTEELTCENLLFAPSFNVSYNQFNIITEVTHD